MGLLPSAAGMDKVTGDHSTGNTKPNTNGSLFTFARDLQAQVPAGEFTFSGPEVKVPASPFGGSPHKRVRKDVTSPHPQAQSFTFDASAFKKSNAYLSNTAVPAIFGPNKVDTANVKPEKLNVLGPRARKHTSEPLSDHVPAALNVSSHEVRNHKPNVSGSGNISSAPVSTRAATSKVLGQPSLASRPNGFNGKDTFVEVESKEDDSEDDESDSEEDDSEVDESEEDESVIRASHLGMLKPPPFKDNFNELLTAPLFTKPVLNHAKDLASHARIPMLSQYSLLAGSSNVLR
ncbi:hypothetical protein F5Y15DRAFT_117596 [Xylariaceae sp. FL0016]|nr:hypothetical protein F5Y15DRAFT_117596 [Xylariaceae sp. FL0016]